MRKFLPLAAVLLLTAGCQKLNYEKTVEVDTRSAYTMEFDPPAYSQNVKATITPADASVSAYFVKSSDVQALEAAIRGQKLSEAKFVIASKTFNLEDPPQGYTLEASIPANQGYTLVLFGGRKASKVKVKVVGR